jgi:hypothetical protein
MDHTGSEVHMATEHPQKKTFIMDLERLNTYNEQGCPACGKKFNLGDTVVVACGSWNSEAVFDKKISAFVDRKCLLP